jgi:hypothetical protein
MSALSADKILNPDVSIQAKVTAWLVNKSDTTILLFLLLYGVWVKSDTMLLSLQQGYDKNAAALEKAVDKLIVEKEKDRQFFMALIAAREMKAQTDQQPTSPSP